MMLLAVCSLGVVIFASIIIVTAYRKWQLAAPDSTIVTESIDAMQSAGILCAGALLTFLFSLIRLRRR